MLACIIILIAVSAPALLRQILPKNVEKELRVRTLSEIELEKPKENNILKEVPPPPPVLARNTIKFTPPVIKPDEQVNEEDEPKMQKEVVEQKAAIGAVDFDKGTDDITAPLAKVAENTKITEEEDAPFVIVEQMPQFPGGEKEMMKFIYANLKYPDEAFKKKITGNVYVTFLVSNSGKIKNAEVKKAVHPLLDAEAKRVIGSMPDWKPGTQSGKAVDVNYMVPVEFKLK